MARVILVVHVPEWVLAEDGCVVAVGDPFRGWLTMDEEERDFIPSQSVSRINGQARLLLTGQVPSTNASPCGWTSALRSCTGMLPPLLRGRSTFVG